MMTLILIILCINALLIYNQSRLGEWALVGYQSIKSNWQKLKKENPALVVLNNFSTLEQSVKYGKFDQRVELPKYKFFTDLILELLQLHKKLGINLSLYLPKIRLELQRDYRFEKKVQELMINCAYQFLIIIAVTWGFIFFSSMMINVFPSGIVVVSILFLQFIGVVIFFYLKHFLYQKTFLELEKIIEKFYKFLSLIDVGIPMAKVLEYSQIAALSNTKEKNLTTYAQRVNQLLIYWQQNGHSPKSEMSEILEDIWALKETLFEAFLKKLEVLKFIVLALFYLPAYFLYLFSIFQFFMEQ